MFARIYELPLGVHGGSECEFFFFFAWPQIILPLFTLGALGKARRAVKSDAIDLAGFFFLPGNRTVSFSTTIVSLLPLDRSLITASLINPICICAGMPELCGRLAGRTVRQVQWEDVYGSQLRLDTLRGRWVWKRWRDNFQFQIGKERPLSKKYIL